MDLTFYVERKIDGEWQELTLSVIAHYEPGRSSRIWGGPDNWEPAEPEEIEFSVTLNGKSFVLDEDEEQVLMDKIREAAHDEYEAASEAAAEERYEDRYDRYDY